MITAPYGPVQNLTVTTPSPETLQVRWDDIDLFKRRGQITHYVIKFFQYSHPWDELLYGDGRLFTLTSTKLTFTFSPVANNTLFDVNVYGVTVIGDGPPLDVPLQIRTLENGKYLTLPYISNWKIVFNLNNVVASWFYEFIVVISIGTARIAKQ